jgi:3',5'-cyclic AMP phosphodiesterase CpdA
MATTAQSHLVSGTEVNVHQADIQGLKSDTTYIFKLEGVDTLHRFRTLPQKLTKLSELRFVVGGDIFYYWGTHIFEEMNQTISQQDPDFVVLGGDLAYVIGEKQALKGRVNEANRWRQFLQILQATLHSKEGRMIPIMPVVGNHDVHKKNKKHQELDVFYEIFPFPEKGKAYRMMTVGNILDLLLLDTGHTWPIAGEQTEWLENELEDAEASYLFAAYHVGAYPSVYSYKGTTPTLLRKTWVPLFEEAQVGAAFEHHSHAFKRTYPIRQGKKDPAGVIYLGDGSWGVPTRKVHTPEKMWYLEKTASTNACWFVRLTEKKAELEARNLHGEIIDSVTLFPRSL